MKTIWSIASALFGPPVPLFSITGAVRLLFAFSVGFAATAYLRWCLQ